MSRRNAAADPAMVRERQEAEALAAESGVGFVAALRQVRERPRHPDVVVALSDSDSPDVATARVVAALEKAGVDDLDVADFAGRCGYASRVGLPVAVVARRWVTVTSPAA